MFGAFIEKPLNEYLGAGHHGRCHCSVSNRYFKESGTLTEAENESKLGWMAL
jgi:hypothetical protein